MRAPECTPTYRRIRCSVAQMLLAALLPLLGIAEIAQALPAVDPKTGLPLGSDLDEDATANPREVFHSETLRGHRSYATNLGNLAFNSPNILGDAARKAHISCGTCHVNGASNAKLFIPGLSTHPGNFDTTSGLFNPKADDGVLDPLTIPSLRGARFLAPYGHDGRIGSLRDFVRNVIVNEFAGAEPSNQIVDAIVVYIEDIDFLPNPNLDQAQRLKAGANTSQLRGEALFSKPFPHDASMSCAACHMPSAAFADHRQHDVGTGGFYKTPTLVNANFNAPYLHDGRFTDYGQVIDHFDRQFELALTPQDRADLSAYLTAVGDGTRPEYHLTGNNVLEDIDGYASVLDLAIATHDSAVVKLATISVSDMLEDLADHYVDAAQAPRPSAVADNANNGAGQRALARATLGKLVEITRQVQRAADAKRWDQAAAAYVDYRKMTIATVPQALQAAENFSLFNPALRAAQTRGRYAVSGANDILPSSN
jgi:Di-haem cytochrome c peroxidase